MVAKHIRTPPLAGSSKGPRSSRFVGLLLCLGLRHDIAVLCEHGLEGMGDHVLARLEAAALDRLVDGSPQHSGNPDVHLAVSPIPARLAKPLNALDVLSVRHGIHPLDSGHIER